jgi:hypothetical protein
MYVNVTLWRARVTALAIELQQCVPFPTVVVLRVAVNNINPSSVATETQRMLSGYKTIRTAVDNVNVPRSSRKVSNIYVRF